MIFSVILPLSCSKIHGINFHKMNFLAIGSAPADSRKLNGPTHGTFPSALSTCSTSSRAKTAQLLFCQGESIRTSIYDEYSGAIKITTCLDHICRCKTASGTNWLNGRTYRVFFIHARRDYSRMRPRAALPTSVLASATHAFIGKPFENSLV